MKNILKLFLALALSVTIGIAALPLTSFALAPGDDYYINSSQNDAPFSYIINSPESDRPLRIHVDSSDGSVVEYNIHVVEKKGNVTSDCYLEGGDFDYYAYRGTSLGADAETLNLSFPIEITARTETIDETHEGVHYNIKVVIDVHSLNTNTGNYYKPLVDDFEYQIDHNEDDIVEWNEGTALPLEVMRILSENPTQSLLFSFDYEGVSHKVFIPAGKAIFDDSIEWFGPLWLLDKYGEYNPDANHGVYIVKKGDTLGAISNRLGVSVEDLMKMNPHIKNQNKIYPGNEIKY